MTEKRVKERMLLGGKWVDRHSTIKVYDPETSRLIATVPEASEKDIALAIETARYGAKQSAKLAIHERINILNRTASYIESQKELFVNTIIRESSKTIREARKEVKRCIETIRISAEEARRITGETIPFSQMDGHENRVGYYYRFPIGIVAAITPFNDPLNLVAHKVAPAIAAGNAVILKPATETPLSSIRLAEAFISASLPESILTVITGYGSKICPKLVAHEDVRFVSFTGGYKTGKSITQLAGVKKLAMELGSNSPTIVLEDALVGEAVQSTVSGSFGVAGQNCIGVQRIYVSEVIFETFLEQFVEKTKQLKLGSKKLETTDVGPMISEKEAKRVEQLIQEAIDEGASLCCGGTRNHAFLEPTVLTNVSRQTTIAREEIFGPVVIIESVESMNEAIRLANDCQYGLQAGIFTNDIKRAFKAIDQLHFGAVMVNDSSDVRIDSMPFGGVNRSGIGREGIRYTIEAMTEQKVVSFQLK